MKEERISFPDTIFSVPVRGKGGNSNYRGNCCPQIVEAFIGQYKMSYLSDYAIGGGTTRDVCQRKGIKGYWTDLRLGFDLLNHEIPDRPENIFYHPPYWDMNGTIIYSNTEYDWRAVQNQYGYDPRLSDLSQAKSWDDFVKLLDYTVIKQFSALETGGRMGILMGDIKTQGKLYSMLLSMAKPGTIEQVIIKAQHNCVSDQTIYKNNNFVKIAHEYFLILRKDSPYTMDYCITRRVSLDIRDSTMATWKDVIASVMDSIGRPATLQEIYSEVDGCRKCANNSHWKEKIRQTLQLNKIFASEKRGTWKLMSAA